MLYIIETDTDGIQRVEAATLRRAQLELVKRLGVAVARQTVRDDLAGTCTSHNGTYNCQLDAGHPGSHAEDVFSGGGHVLAWWADNYSDVRFRGAHA